MQFYVNNVNPNNTTTNVITDPKQKLIFGIIFMLIGLGLIGYSLYRINDYSQKNKSYIEINAIVVDYDVNDEGNKAVIVEYVVNQKTYRKTSNVYSDYPDSIGSRIELKYNSKNPSDAIWKNDSTNIVLPIGGGVFTLIGIFVVVTSFRKMKNDEV